VASLNLLTSAAPIVIAGQLLTSSKLRRQKTMTWHVDQWRYSVEKCISGVTLTWQVDQKRYNNVTSDRWRYNTQQVYQWRCNCVASKSVEFK
jgi:hypothetical protein